MTHDEMVDHLKTLGYEFPEITTITALHNDIGLQFAYVDGDAHYWWE